MTVRERRALWIGLSLLLGISAAVRPGSADAGGLPRFGIKEPPLFPFLMKDGKWNFADQADNIIFGDLKFDSVSPFSEGLACVRKKDGFQYIDLFGKQAFDRRFEMATSFSEGLAAVKEEGRFGYIDTLGKMTIRASFDRALPFREGLAAVKERGKYRFIDSRGQPAFEGTFDAVISFSEGMAGVRRGEKFGFIDRRGNRVGEPRYDQVLTCREGKAGVLRDGKWGFVDNRGVEVIKPQFESVLPFSEGIGAARVEGKYVFIDREGNRLPGPTFDAIVEPFRNRHAIVRQGKTLVIVSFNPKGEVRELERRIVDYFVVQCTANKEAEIYVYTLWDFDELLLEALPLEEVRPTMITDRFEGRTDWGVKVLPGREYRFLFVHDRQHEWQKCVPGVHDQLKASFR